jgi:hypothetical protein
VLDTYSLEIIITKLVGRKKEQQSAIREKQRARVKLERLWSRLCAWCALPASALIPELKALAAAVKVPNACDGVTKQRFPWTPDTGGPSLQPGLSMARVSAALRRAYSEQARCSEESAELQVEVARTVAACELRCRLLQGALGAAGSPSGKLLLRQHLGWWEGLRASFQALAANPGQEPQLSQEAPF